MSRLKTLVRAGVAIGGLLVIREIVAERLWWEFQNAFDAEFWGQLKKSAEPVEPAPVGTEVQVLGTSLLDWSVVMLFLNETAISDWMIKSIDLSPERRAWYEGQASARVQLARALGVEVPE